MIQAVNEMIEHDENTALFLADIGVWGFRNILRKYPERAMNIGIFEDGMISIAAGMASQGIIPTIYGITPYIVERALEQLKLDFAYQKLGGNFITTGAAYDFSTLGYSHYCPEDVGILKMIPGFQIITPGTGKEFTTLFQDAYNNESPTYFRLSDYSNSNEIEVEFGKATVIKKGEKATIVVVSIMLDTVLEACAEEDVTILYYTTLEPFDRETLKRVDKNRKILLCEPHFRGTLITDIVTTFPGESVQIETVGIPMEIQRSYGSKKEKDVKNGLTVANVKEKLKQLLN
jgi:Transketolase, C-terminal subunit